MPDPMARKSKTLRLHSTGTVKESPLKSLFRCPPTVAAGQRHIPVDLMCSGLSAVMACNDACSYESFSCAKLQGAGMNSILAIVKVCEAQIRTCPAAGLASGS